MTARVEFKQIGHHFGDFVALNKIDLDIEAGEYAVLLGPSGCGKTTLLMILAGFIPPTTGDVLIGGQSYQHVPPSKRPTTTMFQDYALFPHMTVAANVMFGPRMRGISRQQAANRAMELLEMVNLADAYRKKPHELSGGQRQRVALARALAVEPDVLLLDEPLGALDLKLRKQMQDELKAIQRKVGTTFIHVTHDQEEAMAIADKIVVMNHGRVEDSGSADRVYLRPATRFTAEFMGEINLIPVQLSSQNGSAVCFQSSFGAIDLPLTALLTDTLRQGDTAQLGIRPEHFRLTDRRNALSLGVATVKSAAFFGAHIRALLSMEADPDRILIAHFPQASEISEGERITVEIDRTSAFVIRN